jgi:dynein heavy chain
VIQGSTMENNWLNDVSEEMRRTLRYHMSEAVETAVSWEVEKPRHKLFEYPAQILLNVTLIYWTEETEQALKEFEGGQKDRSGGRGGGEQLPGAYS